MLAIAFYMQNIQDFVNVTDAAYIINKSENKTKVALHYVEQLEEQKIACLPRPLQGSAFSYPSLSACLSFPLRFITLRYFS